MNSWVKKCLALIFASLLCSILAGCGILQKKIQEYSISKEHCFLNYGDSIVFAYQSMDYTILADTVSSENLGEWVGYIRQYVIVNQQGELLLQVDTIDDLLQCFEGWENYESGVYVISFYNIYAMSDGSAYLIADVNGEYHKAIPSSSLVREDEIFTINNFLININQGFIINPDNATQLLYGDTVYQVTSEVVPENELGMYLDILAKNVTFDTETKKPLQKKEMNRINVFGTGEQQYRSSWFYKDVYEIYGKDINEVIAVSVNNCYYLAKRQ